MTNDKTLSILDIKHDTTVDGPGFRTAIYFAGCEHRCPECHNPQSWEFIKPNASIDEIAKIIEEDPFADITLTGGDPFYQSTEVAALIRRVKGRLHKNVWAYTGFRYEYLRQHLYYIDLLSQVDVLVDGPFVKKLADPDLLFRGSSNQRLIDVKRSTIDNVVLYSY